MLQQAAPAIDAISGYVQIWKEGYVAVKEVDIIDRCL